MLTKQLLIINQLIHQINKKVIPILKTLGPRKFSTLEIFIGKTKTVSVDDISNIALSTLVVDESGVYPFLYSGEKGQDFWIKYQFTEEKSCKNLLSFVKSLQKELKKHRDFLQDSEACFVFSIWEPARFISFYPNDSISDNKISAPICGICSVDQKGRQFSLWLDKDTKSTSEQDDVQRPSSTSIHCN